MTYIFLFSILVITVVLFVIRNRFRPLTPDGAGCILLHNDKVLLLERNPNYVNNRRKAHELEFPGGKYDARLDAVPYYDTALREVREETGIILNAKQIKQSAMIISKTPSNKGSALFVVNLTSDQVLDVEKLRKRLNDAIQASPDSREAQDMIWIPVASIKDFVMNNNQSALPLKLRPFNIPYIKQLIVENKL